MSNDTVSDFIVFVKAESQPRFQVNHWTGQVEELLDGHAICSFAHVDPEVHPSHGGVTPLSSLMQAYALAETEVQPRRLPGQDIFVVEEEQDDGDELFFVYWIVLARTGTFEEN